MNFKYKCLLHHTLSVIPMGGTINFLLQKHITKTLPISNQIFIKKINLAYRHFLNYKKYNEIRQPSNLYFEFGAGPDLAIPIMMGLLGFEVTCIDIRKLAFDELVNDIIHKYYTNKNHLPFDFPEEKFINRKYTINDIRKYFNVNYTAPADARKTNLKDNSQDFISSTLTVEHIPPGDLLLILKECYRILQPGGIFSVSIDYTDNWSNFDKNISIYNNLQYSDSTWKWFNPGVVFQNRLRHKDYLELISKSGFTVVDEWIDPPGEEDIRTLESLKIDQKFSTYTLQELGIKSSKLVLKKPIKTA